MATFTVKGPYEVPVIKEIAARIITKTETKQFWDEHGDLANERGCYVATLYASDKSGFFSPA